MAEMGRASRYQAINDPLAVLGLGYVQRRDQLPSIDTAGEPLNAALRLAEAIEKHSSLSGQPLSLHLLSSLANIEPAVLGHWLRIALDHRPLGGFAQWFSAKLDEIGFERHHDTPSSVSRLVASLFSNHSFRTIFDPACGTGGLLAAAAEHNAKAALFGQEISSEAWAWAEMRFLVQGLGNINLAIGNGLDGHALTSLIPEDGLDFILTNPPFGMQFDANTISGPSRRPGKLIPTQAGRLSSETAYVQGVLEYLSNSGLAAVIVPNGFLSRGGADKKLREALVRLDVVQAVIGLPERLFAPGTNIETAILVLNRRKPDDQKEHILFLDARELGRREGMRVVIDDQSAARIMAGYNEWRNEMSFSQVVSSDKIDLVSFSFSPTRYVKYTSLPARMDPDYRRSHIIELDAQYRALCLEYEDLQARLSRLD
ncbi:N-6 DNA methylase [Bosea sp. (in: a-proteobacteria)]|uniref:N-6 DNA methylase n=1 Tax=Bosea sp. (in: a-proteobacteria) TaxID=1871050 RepID=UPI003B3ACDC5